MIPTARATAITMNRDKIRDLAANELKIKTAKFFYASNCDELKNIAKTQKLFLQKKRSVK